MTEAIVAALFLTARLARAAQKAFIAVPARELRRRSAKGDEYSHQLYLAARYEGSLQIFLEIIVISLFSSLIYLIFANLPMIWAMAVSIALLYYFFVVTPQTASQNSGKKIASLLAPALAKILRFLSPALHIIQPASYKRSRFVPLFDSDDLVDFLKAQEKVEASRISPVDLNRAIAALEHRDVFVGDVMISAKKMTIVNEKDEVGPILLSELHKSGQDCFAVGKPDHISGVISLEKLVEMKQGGLVSNAMDRRLVYVRSDWLLSEAVDVFLQTKKTIYLVINQKQKVLGIISFQKILNEVFAKSEAKDTKNFFDRSEVAGQ